MTALTIGAAFLSENAAHYAVGGDGPTPDHERYPMLNKALEVVEGNTPDQLFGLYLRTYLDSIRREMDAENSDSRTRNATG